MKKSDPEAMVDKIFKEEVERCMLNSLVMCLFARKVYDRPTILSALNAIGYNLKDEDLTNIAERIYVTKLRIKKAMGFEQEKVRFPKRFFETPSMHGLLNEEAAYRAQEKYNELTNALLAKFEESQKGVQAGSEKE
jgi:aldehyde:ferredoxin oxidoreductase